MFVSPKALLFCHCIRMIRIHCTGHHSGVITSVSVSVTVSVNDPRPRSRRKSLEIVESSKFMCLPWSFSEPMLHMPSIFFSSICLQTLKGYTKNLLAIFLT